MDIIASPFVTVILNMVASILVAKGVLDSHSAIAFVQVGNSLIAGIMTVAVAVVSIYKMVDLQKHRLTMTSQAPSQPVSQPITQTQPVGQSGISIAQNLGSTTPSEIK